MPRLGTMPSPCAACSVRLMSLCGALDESEIREVAAITTALAFKAGEPLIDEGQPATHVFNVTSGAIKVYKLLIDGRRQMTGFLFPGDFLGLANDDVYAYSAETVTVSTVCRFPRRRLEALLVRYPKMERRLLGIASHELAAAQEQMLLLGRKTAREKIASFLAMLSRRAAQRELESNPVTVPMSRNDIGDYLGLTTETVSRTFSQLKASGIIELLAGGKVRLGDPAKLQDIADGA
jgi:CRP/FNR family transcriptional regulator